MKNWKKSRWFFSVFFRFSQFFNNLLIPLIPQKKSAKNSEILSCPRGVHAYSIYFVDITSLIEMTCSSVIFGRKTEKRLKWVKFSSGISKWVFLISNSIACFHCSNFTAFFICSEKSTSILIRIFSRIPGFRYGRIERIGSVSSFQCTSNWISNDFTWRRRLKDRD